MWIILSEYSHVLAPKNGMPNSVVVSNYKLIEKKDEAVAYAHGLRELGHKNIVMFEAGHTIEVL